MTTFEPLPKLSVVVICYEMAAQIKSPLQSIVPPYQRNISIGEYEITMSRDLFSNIDGVDEQSRVPGGGLANLDFFARRKPSERSSENASIAPASATFPSATMRLFRWITVQLKCSTSRRRRFCRT
jgi:hypothetical protein